MMKKTGLLLVILAAYLSLDAQDIIKISTPEVTFLNKIITVRYDITGCGTGDYINIKLIVLDAEGDTIKPVYVSGDIGSRVNCGFGKKIEWNVEKDSIKINKELEIQVTGKPVVTEIPSYIPVQKSISRGNIVLSSVFLPGLGQKKASGKGGHLVFSGLVYGMLGTSLYAYLRSTNYHDNYIEASGTEADDFFVKSVNSYNLSMYMLYGAAGIWTINMIWSAVIPIRETAGKKMNVSIKSLPENGYLVTAKWTF